MIRLDGKKELSLVSWAIKKTYPPKMIRVLLEQENRRGALPCVSVGSEVLVGQKIAEPVNPESVCVHSGISGKVSAIGMFAHPVLGQVPGIEIQGDGEQKMYPNTGRERPGWENLPPAEILNIFREFGIVGMSSLEPAHVKNHIKKYSKVHTLILNGCESEPYMTSNHSLMMSHPLEILKGAEILRKTINAGHVIFALDETQREAAEILKSKIYFLKWENFEARVLPALYPQDHESALVTRLLGMDPFAYLQDEISPVQIHDVATCFSVYEAVVLQKPLYERVVTLGGECTVDSFNAWVPIGTSFEDAFKFCRGFLREPRRVLMNGPMRGTAQSDLGVSITANTRAILALPKELMPENEISPCIRCGACVEGCPVGLSPAMITLAAEKEDFEMAKDWGAGECIECGNCSYVCPAKRPMLELVRFADSAPDFTAGHPDKIKNLMKRKKEKRTFAEI